MSVMIIEIGQWPIKVVAHHLKQIGYNGKIAALDDPEALLDGFTSGIVLTGDAVMTASELVRQRIDIRFIGSISDVTGNGFNVIVHEDILALAKQYLEAKPEPAVSGRLRAYGTALRHITTTTSH